MQWNSPLVHNGMPQGTINSSRSSIGNWVPCLHDWLLFANAINYSQLSQLIALCNLTILQRPGMEPRSLGPLANTLAIRTMSQSIYIYIYIYSSHILVYDFLNATKTWREMTLFWLLIWWQWVRVVLLVG